MCYNNIDCVTDQWDYTTVQERRSLYHDIVVYQMVTISGLVPFSQYDVQVNASNSMGFILGSVQTIHLPPGSELLVQGFLGCKTSDWNISSTVNSRCSAIGYKCDDVILKQNGLITLLF